MSRLLAEINQNSEGDTLRTPQNQKQEHLIFTGESGSACKESLVAYIEESNGEAAEGIFKEARNESKQNYVRFNEKLDAHTVEQDFLNQNIVERKHSFTNDEMLFFIDTYEKELKNLTSYENTATQKEDFLEMVQKKYGTFSESSKKKVQKPKSKVKEPERELIKPEMSKEAEKRYEKILVDLEYLKTSKLLYKHDPITSYFMAVGSVPTSTRAKEYKHNPSLLDIPVIISNSVFKEMEKKVLDENLNPYLKNVLLPTFRKQYDTFILEILAERTLVFYGLGYKKAFIEDFTAHLSNDLKSYYKLDDEVPICEINGLDVPNRYNTLYNVFRDFIMVPPSRLKEFEQVIDKRDRQLWGDHALDELEMLQAYYSHIRSSKSNRVKKLGLVKVILVIHNADAEMFRKPSFKKFVAAIAKVPVIALILTTDHVRFPFSFERNLIDMITPSYHPLTTLKPYPIEGYINQNDRDRFFSYFDVLKAEEGSLKKRNVKVSSSTKGPSVYDEDSGLNNIFSTLTKKNLKIFKLLVQTLLERMKTKKGSSKAKSHRIPLREFLSLCQKELLVSDEVSLRKALSEFVDHSLCSLGDRNRIGVEFLDSGYSEAELSFLLVNQLNDLAKYF